MAGVTSTRDTDMTTINENTFAAACYEMNSIAELEAAIAGPADKIDMTTWGLTEQEWRDEIALALKAKRGDAC
jgi:hypothetical protein